MAWDTRLTVVLVCGSAGMQAFEQAAKDKAMFADFAPVFATAWWNYAPATLLVIAGALWAWRQWRGPATSNTTATGAAGASPKPMIDAFERHAAEEHLLSHMCGPNVVNGGLPLEGRARDSLRLFLRNFETAAMQLNLDATRDAIRQAIAHFEEPGINLITAYSQYRSVSLAFRDELERRKRLVSI